MSAVHGLLLEVSGPGALIAAAEAARKRGLTAIDAFTPHPVEGLTEAIGAPPSRIPWIMLGCGIVGALTAFGTMTFAAVFDYPFLVGGRPLFSWPAFVPIAFELTILFAALSGALALAWKCRLPRPHHPVFNDERFRDAMQAGFFLLLADSDEAREFLDERHPGAWKEVAE